MPDTKFSTEPVLMQPGCPGAVIQELIIHPGGAVEVPWVTPAASALILAVWQEINNEPFPIKIISGQLYCG